MIEERSVEGMDDDVVDEDVVEVVEEDVEEEDDFAWDEFDGVRFIIMCVWKIQAGLLDEVLGIPWSLLASITLALSLALLLSWFCFVQPVVQRV